MKGWILLLIAVVLEVTATSILNTSDGFRKIFPSVAALATYAISFFVFSRALQYMPLGIAYAVWSGFGIIIVCLIGSFIFKQELSIWSYVGVFLIIAGTMIAYLAGNSQGN